MENWGASWKIGEQGGELGAGGRVLGIARGVSGTSGIIGSGIHIHFSALINHLLEINFKSL